MNPIKPISFPIEEIDIPDHKSVPNDQGSKISSVGRQKKMEEISRAIQKEVGGGDIRLKYSLDRPTGQIVVKVIDGNSGKVIREIPPSELLALAQSMKELEGLLFDAHI